VLPAGIVRRVAEVLDIDGAGRDDPHREQDQERAELLGDLPEDRLDAAAMRSDNRLRQA